MNENDDSKPRDLSLHDLSGKKARLRDYRGHPIVLNFWATWCGPCREEIPLIAEAEGVWKSKGVVFITASLDGARARGEISRFLVHYRVDLPVWIGATVDDLEAFGLGDGIPDTVFLDERGTLVFRVRGEIRRTELERRLEWLTGRREDPPPARFVNHM